MSVVSGAMLRRWAHVARMGLRHTGADSSARAGKGESKESPLKRLLDDSTAFGEAEPQEGELHWHTQPYATSPARSEPPPHVDPAHTSILLFPGQGSQHLGMAKPLLKIPAAKELYDLASEVLGWDVARVCNEGPQKELLRHCQVCVLVTSLAALELARETRPGALERVRAVAGFSLGELTALTYARALSLESALRVTAARAAAMEAAAAERQGAMLTVWLAADAELNHALLRARQHAADKGIVGPVCQVANYMYPNCKVVAGDEDAIKWLELTGRKFGIRRSARVAVSGAFHTALMDPARGVLVEALNLADVRAPQTRVVSAVDGKPYRDARHIRKQLPKQVVAPVRWEQTLHALFARTPGEAFPLTLALGPGTALRATLKQVNAKAWDSSLQIHT